MIQFITTLFNNIKNCLLLGFGLLSTGFALLFLYERNKNTVNEALLKQEKFNDGIKTLDDKIAQNNAALEVEEQKRDAVKEDTSETNITDIATYLSNRK